MEDRIVNFEIEEEEETDAVINDFYDKLLTPSNDFYDKKL